MKSSCASWAETEVWVGGSTIFSSSSSAFPAISLGFTIFGEIFVHVTFGFVS